MGVGDCEAAAWPPFTWGKSHLRPAAAPASSCFGWSGDVLGAQSHLSRIALMWDIFPSMLAPTLSLSARISVERSWGTRCELNHLPVLAGFTLTQRKCVLVCRRSTIHVQISVIKVVGKTWVFFTRLMSFKHDTSQSLYSREAPSEGTGENEEKERWQMMRMKK